MNTLNRFIVTSLLMLFASQAFAIIPKVIKIERTGLTTLTITHDQPVKERNPNANYGIYMKTNEKIYVGSSNSEHSRTVVAVNPNTEGYAIAWEMEVVELVDMDNDNITTIDEMRVRSYGWSNNSNPIEWMTDAHSVTNLSLYHFSFISVNTLNANEGTELIHTLAASDTATFRIIENTDGLFSLSGTNNATLKFNGTTTDFESNKKSYTVKIKAENNTNNKNAEQTITVKLIDLNDETPTAITFAINEETSTAITLKDNLTINENTAIGTELGTLSATDADTNNTFTYTSSNAILSINGDKLKLNAALDYESATSFSATITVTDGNHHSFDRKFNFTVGNIDDTAPTNIVLTRVSIALNAIAGAIVGILSATDVDTDNNKLTYGVNPSSWFLITGNQLKVKSSVATTAKIFTSPIRISITVRDGTSTSTENFNIAFNAVNTNITPVVKQFIVTQGGNSGRLISKNGGTVTVNALVTANIYDWSKSDVTGTSANTIFSFDPANIEPGILTIKLEAKNDDLHSSTRVLKLKLIAGDVDSNNNDSDNDGIPNNKDNNTAGNKIQAGEGKTITNLNPDIEEDTSPNSNSNSNSGKPRVLLGIMGKDSGRLTLEQVKQYIADNKLTDNASDTATTGDIYDYIVEGLSAVGASTQVIIELTTAIPKDAELRKYSLTSGWDNFIVDTENTIESSTDNTCTNDSTWKTGLIVGATCLKLTIKDGGENDTDGGQANGVVESTISIATPASSGGGCVYNPNAPARFDMGFILLMILGVYYLIRRKQRLIR